MLADFGLCKIALEHGETSKSWRPDGEAAGRAKYIAPEVHDLTDVQAELFGGYVGQIGRVRLRHAHV